MQFFNTALKTEALTRIYASLNKLQSDQKKRTRFSLRKISQNDLWYTFHSSDKPQDSFTHF